MSYLISDVLQWFPETITSFISKYTQSVNQRIIRTLFVVKSSNLAHDDSTPYIRFVVKPTNYYGNNGSLRIITPTRQNSFDSSVVYSFKKKCCFNVHFYDYILCDAIISTSTLLASGGPSNWNIFGYVDNI